ncbi:MAG: 50S ribosomal protein L10 [Desulfovibrio sp.]|nr:50S ribosomal protein L10 [Desulfovibrio sp.]
MNRTEKAAVITKIRAGAENASIAVVVDFKGMPVEEMTRLREKLRGNGAELLVVKNTLARIAFAGSPHEVIKDHFRENCAIALGSHDPVAAAKALTDFARTSKNLVLRHASLDGRFLAAEQIDALARLPGRKELLARTLGTLNAVPTNFVSLLANVIRGMLYALKAIEEKKAA